MVFNILALISTLIILTLLRRLVYLFPSLVSCAIRWKENVNLEASVKNSYDRNIIAIGMIIPFGLVVEKFRLYTPSFMDGMDDDLRIGVIFGVLAGYYLVRILASMMVRTRRDRKKTFDTAAKASYTFFILLTLSLVAVGGVTAFTGIEETAIRSAMLWISAFIYAVLLLRKLQIFASGFSIFASFLYLCALEILPTGLLIASALIF